MSGITGASLCIEMLQINCPTKENAGSYRLLHITCRYVKSFVTTTYVDQALKTRRRAEARQKIREAHLRAAKVAQDTTQTMKDK